MSQKIIIYYSLKKIEVPIISRNVALSTATRSHDHEFFLCVRKTVSKKGTIAKSSLSEVLFVIPVHRLRCSFDIYYYLSELLGRLSRIHQPH